MSLHGLQASIETCDSECSASNQRCRAGTGVCDYLLVGDSYIGWLSAICLRFSLQILLSGADEYVPAHIDKQRLLQR